MSRSIPGVCVAILVAAGLTCALPAGGAERPEGTWQMRHSDVVFMYVPKTPDLYDAYGASVVLWGGGADNAKAAREHGVHFQASMWFLTAWGDKLAEDPELLKAVCVDIEGKPIGVPWLTDHKQKLPNYWGCTNAPYYREYLKRQAQDAVKGEAIAGLHIDDHCGTSACASYAGGCFCPHCRAGFRAYLKEHHTPAQLTEMGVADVDAFDYAEYVRGYAKTRQLYTAKARSIPLYTPFMNFQARAEAALVGEVRVLCEKAAGRALSLSANCGLPSPLHLADYMHLNTLCGEIGLDAGAGKPSEVSHLAYKVADAVHRPLAATGSGWDWAWVAEKGKPGLVKTWVAESYAFGHRLMAPHHQWCYTAEKGTHWWDGRTEDFAPLYHHVSAHRELFDGFEALSDVVVVFNSPAAYRGKDPSADIARFLASRSIAYRVAMAGGDWVDERLDRKDLLGAKAVIVGTEEFLDEGQRATLAAVEKAGKLVRWQGPASCEGKVPQSIRVEGAANVWALPRRNGKTGEVALHLLNRSYVLERDAMAVTEPFRVTLDRALLGRKAFRSAVLHAIPGGQPTALSLASTPGQVTVEVPETNLWSIVVLR